MVTGTATLVGQVVDCWEPAGFTDNGYYDDAAASIHPGADELCNGIDDDCDAAIDEDDHRTFYEDKDGDGFGNAVVDDRSVQACAAPGALSMTRPTATMTPTSIPTPNASRRRR